MDYCAKNIKKSGILIFSFLVFSVFGNIVYATGKHISSNELCNLNIPKQFEKVHDVIVRVWTELDVLRSISIQKEDREMFAHKMLYDIMIVLKHVTKLTSSCTYCSSQCRKQCKEIMYLEDTLNHVVDAFKAVFKPQTSNAESAFQTLLLEVLQMWQFFKNLYQ